MTAQIPLIQHYVQFLFGLKLQITFESMGLPARRHMQLWSSTDNVPVVITVGCCVCSSSSFCHSPCLSHFTPGPDLQLRSPGLHLQSTPLHNPWIPCSRCTIVLLSTVVIIRAWLFLIHYLLPHLV